MDGQVLIVDDDIDLGQMIVVGLEPRGITAVFVTNPEEALRTISERDFDAIVTDLNMPQGGGLHLCTQVNENRPDIPVIVITAYGSLEAAIGAIRSGAYDFVTKPFNLDVLVLALERAIRQRRTRDEVRRLRRVISDSQHFEEIIGNSPVMLDIYDLLNRLTDSDATVFLSGESGTGKEVAARALHTRSRRRNGPFVAINCAAMPGNLLESELFGHARGAYTDAKSSRAGLLAQADGGTLFLDEIGDMPLALQPKLLRAIEERSVRPLGSNRDLAFDARLIAATNRDLESLVEQGQFREDLYYRINVVHVALPPLRARGGDVLQLAQVFLEKCATRAGSNVRGIGAKAAEKLLAYTWPGNVRELRNVIERAVALTRYDTLSVEDLPEKVRNHLTSHVVVAASDPTELVTLEEVEHRYIERVLQAAGGNKTMAAQILGLDRTTLYRKLHVRESGFAVVKSRERRS